MSDERKANRQFASVCLWLCLCVCVIVTAAAESRAQVVTDRLVAIVNDEAVTYSDLLWQLALQPQTPLTRPRPGDLSQTLERIIDQRLVAQEAVKLPSIRPTDAETDAALAELIKQFPSLPEFNSRAESVGLTPEVLRDIVRARVAIDKFLEFRFRAFTVVAPQDIESYYRDVYTTRFRASQPGRIVPTLDAARETIRQTLTEQKIAADTDAFLQDARAGAEIVRLARF